LAELTRPNKNNDDSLHNYDYCQPDVLLPYDDLYGSEFPTGWPGKDALTKDICIEKNAKSHPTFGWFFFLKEAPAKLVKPLTQSKKSENCFIHFKNHYAKRRRK